MTTLIVLGGSCKSLVKSVDLATQRKVGIAACMSGTSAKKTLATAGETAVKCYENAFSSVPSVKEQDFTCGLEECDDNHRRDTGSIVDLREESESSYPSASSCATRDENTSGSGKGRLYGVQVTV
jgi:hypothetical protein